MAAPQWSGGKCKSVQQAKAFFRHNDSERRKETQHTNPHIDKSKTHLNFSVKGLTYEQRCAAYDKRMGEIDQGRTSSGKNARTVMQSVILYPPAGLVDDKDKLREWFYRAGEVAEARFGKNMIDMAVDFDEVHQYRDKDGQLRMSLEHGHLWLTPEVDGKLNGKQFSRRAVINGFNAELQEMSLREFGCPMMDGTKAKGGQKVENLKAQSAAKEIEAQARAEARAIVAAAQIEAAGIKKQAQADVKKLREDAEKDIHAREARSERVRTVLMDGAKKDRAEALKQLTEASGLLKACSALHMSVTEQDHARILQERLRKQEQQQRMKQEQIDKAKNAAANVNTTKPVSRGKQLG